MTSLINLEPVDVQRECGGRGILKGERLTGEREKVSRSSTESGKKKIVFKKRVARLVYKITKSQTLWKQLSTHKHVYI